VSGIRSRMLEAGKAPVTINDALKILKLLCRFATKLGMIRELSFRVEFLRVQKKPRPTVSANQFLDFLAAADKVARNPQVGVMLRVMVGLGLRQAEALGMRWEWFNPTQMTYVVGKSKGREARVLPVPLWLWNSIHDMPKTHSEWVFPAEDGKPHRSQFCRKALQRVCKTLGLGNVTQHRLRATFASLHASEANTPITEIQGMLGHKNVQTTMIYVETSMEAKRKAQDTLSQKLGFA
jgi:integrase/recombinase XerC